jgi:hypothetical protein
MDNMPNNVQVGHDDSSLAATDWKDTEISKERLQIADFKNKSSQQLGIQQDAVSDADHVFCERLTSISLRGVAIFCMLGDSDEQGCS